MLRLPNNDLLIPFETYKHFDDPSPWASKSAVVVSSDDGATWKTRLVGADPKLADHQALKEAIDDFLGDRRAEFLDKA